MIIIKRVFHGGLGLDENPMNKIMFYSKYDKEKTYHIIKETNDNDSSVFVYAPHTCTKSDKNLITSILTQHATNNGLKPPNKLHKNDENLV